MSEPPTIEVEDSGGVRRLWFNRPRVHNAQNVEMLRDLQDVLDDTAGNASVRVLVVGGRGPSFCSGHDLKEMAVNAEYAANASTAEGRFRQELRLFVRPVETLQQLDIPTICRVHGYCMAAGLMFVGACDFAVASDDAVFGSPVVRSQGVNDAEVPLLSWRLGERRAKQMLWLDERLSAAQALEAGLLNWVVAAEQLDARVDEVAQRLCTAPPEVLALSKRSFRFLASRQGWNDYAEYHYTNHQFSHQTAEAAQLLRARVERLRDGKSAHRED
jgi:enoyl-CoA hydratase/carnithine racemase